MTRHFVFPKGATPLDDCSGLIPTWVHHLRDLSRVEAENIVRAQRAYLQGSVLDPQRWFQVAELKAMHLAMFGQVWRWAGAYRKSTTSIGVRPGLIPAQLAEFCFEVSSWLQHPVDLTFVEMAARIHHRLVLIHPFENGNGRFSRLVADRFLLAFRCAHPQWPNYLNLQGILRKDYIQTLKYADRGDYAPLVDFMEKLGAKDLRLSEFIKDNFYATYVSGERGPAAVRALLRRGGNPNDQTAQGHRILQLAIKTGLDEIAQILVTFGAEVDAVDRSRLTPLEIALTQGNKTLVDFLLSKGAKHRNPSQ